MDEVKSLVHTQEISEFYDELLCAIEDNDFPQVKRLVDTRELSELTDSGYDLLKKACEINVFEIVKYLLSKNCDVNSTNEYEMVNSPLGYALLSGNAKIVEMLLKRGAHLNDFDGYSKTLINATENCENRILELLIEYSPESVFYGYPASGDYTPLHLAAFWGKSDMIETYLANEAAVNSKPLTGVTPIHCATYRGHLGIVERLINQGGSVNEFANCEEKVNSIFDLRAASSIPGFTYYCCSPLHIAVANEHLNLVKLFLDHGADVNAPYNFNGETALYLASQLHNRANSYAITKLLLSYCPDIKNVSNKRALLNAIRTQKNINTVQCLFEYGFTIDPKYVKNLEFLHAVCELGSLTAMENLIGLGLDVNTVFTVFTVYTLDELNTTPPPSEEGFSLLHKAVIMRHTSLCQLLLKYKADVNIKDSANKSPITYAIKNCDVETTKLLIDNGADSTEEIIESLNTVIRGMCLEIMVLILDNYENVNLNLVDSIGGMTTLHHTVLNKTDFFDNISPKIKYESCDSDDVVRAEIATVLLNKGAAVDSLTSSRFSEVTALIFDATKGCKNIVKLLLDHVANITFRTDIGLSALQAAAICDHKEIVDYLLKSNCDVEALCDYGHQCMLYITAIKNFTDSVELFIKYGSDCSARDSKSRSALHETVANQNQKLLQMQLKCGFNMKVRDWSGKMSLHYACERGLDKHVVVLLNFARRVEDTLDETFLDFLDLKDEQGLTPLCSASAKGRETTVKILLDFGVNVNSQDAFGRTALHHAAIKGQWTTVKALLDAGADVNITSKDGNTPLTSCDKPYHHFHECTEFGPSPRILSVCHLGYAKELLQNQVIKLIVAGLYVDRENSEFPDGSMKFFYPTVSCCCDDVFDVADCIKELEDMKMHVLYDNISLHDVLTASIDKFSKYLKNEEIVWTLKSFNSCEFKDQFPIYFDLILSRFKTAEKRKHLLEECYKSLDSATSDFSQLPYACVENILRYISNEWLIVLISAVAPFVKRSEGGKGILPELSM